MSDDSTSRSGRQQARRWCHEVLDSMGELDVEAMFGFAEEALQRAGNDSVRQMLVELSAGSIVPGVTASLIRASVRSGSTQVARAAADLLIDIKDVSSAKSIIAECLDSGDSAIRVRAVEAMEALNDPEAVTLLQKALVSGDESVKIAAVNSFGLIIGSKYHPLKAGVLESLADRGSDLFRILTGTEDFGLKREAAKVAGFADSDAVLPLLDELSADPDAQTRRETVLALVANGSSKAMEITEKRLDDEDELVVTFALDSLASRVGRDSEYMLKCIKKAMKHPNAAVRRNAVMMLNWFAPSRIETLLSEAAGDPDFEVQRSALSLLRTMKAELAPIGLDAAGAEDRGEDTLRIWEVGNIGMESERSERKTTIDTDIIATDDIVAELERRAASGEGLGRSHAITELIELVDISDSPLLRNALYDDNETVRARAARGLDFTRDACLATQVLMEHPDPLVRRRAIEALVDNPSARTRGKAARSGLTFASERTMGLDLFSYFLSALHDSDEGVVQSACYGIGQYLEFQCPVPARRTIEKLEGLAAGKKFSSLTRDNAAELIDEINEAKPGEPMFTAVNGLMSELGAVAAAASALTPAENDTFYLQSGGDDQQTLYRRLTGELDIEPDTALQIAAASDAGDHLGQEAAASYAASVCGAAETAFTAIAYNAEALAMIGEKRWIEHLDGWADALGDTDMDAFESSPLLRARKPGLIRYLQMAAIHARTAAKVLSGASVREALDAFLDSKDDWVRLAALNALNNALPGGHDTEALKALAENYRADQDYDSVLGRSALLLAKAGQEKGLDILCEVMERCGPSLRNDLLHGLIAAAQADAVAALLEERISSGTLRPSSNIDIWLKMALLAGGGSPAVEPEPEVFSNLEHRYAYAALKAMDNDTGAAEELKAVLRNGEPAERELAAAYLGTARVETATTIFASVSDQVDTTWRLRSQCAGLMVQKGHRQGIGWFNKNASQGGAAIRGTTALSLARATINILPLMLECRSVNAGRFV